MFKAGFAEVDITPPMGTHLIGYLVDAVSTQVLDPLYARVAVFERGEDKWAIVQLDTLSVRWTLTNDIRQRVEKKYGFPGQAIMVSATHNHCGPAVATLGSAPRDEKYIEWMVQRVTTAFGRALEKRADAEIGFGRGYGFSLSCNRRVIMRDGSIASQGSFARPNALCWEGPVDPTVTVLAVRAKNGKTMGSVVHFTCHLARHGEEKSLVTSCHPGVLARIMKERGCPVTVYLNGCAGNVNNGYPDSPGRLSADKLGTALADIAGGLIEKMEWREPKSLGMAKKTLELPFRKVTEADIKGTAPGTQRYASAEFYDAILPGVVARMKERGTNKAEVQTLFMDDFAIAGVPAELFVEYGLKIVEGTGPTQTIVAGYSNGMVGYVPTRQAFLRGGYETTFADSSRLAPEAGDMLADAAIGLIKNR